MKSQKLLQKTATNLTINWKKIAHKTRILNNLLHQYHDYHFDKNDSHLLIEAIVSFLNDFDYHLSFKNVQKILSKSHSQNRWEILVLKISYLFKRTRNFSSQYISQLYQSILREIYTLQNSHIVFLPNHFSALSTKIDDAFFNTIEFEQNIIDFDATFLPFVNVQIVNLEVFNMLNLQQSNLPFSKIITMWYLNQNQKILSSYFYQKAIDLVATQYSTIFFETTQTQNYDKLINFVFDALNKFIFSDQNKNQILQIIFNKYRVIFPKHQVRFLFIIIYYNLNKFDWKKFQKVANLFATKQHIIRNLNVFTTNNLLKYKIFKKRKFYFQSKLLKNLLIENESMNREIVECLNYE